MRSMISAAAVAIGLLAATDARAYEPLGASGLAQLESIGKSVASTLAATNISLGPIGPTGPTGPTGSSDIRSVYKSNQIQMASVAKVVATLSASELAPPGTSSSIKISSLTKEQVVISITFLDSSLNAVMTITATIGIDGNLTSVTASNASGAEMTHTLNSTSGSSSRGDGGGSSGGSESM